jgi:hypothetical protein
MLPCIGPRLIVLRLRDPAALVFGTCASGLDITHHFYASGLRAKF